MDESMTEVYVKMAELKSKLADSFILKELNLIRNRNDGTIDFNSITEEEANTIVQKAIEKKNKLMDEATLKELANMFDKKKIVNLMSKDKQNDETINKPNFNYKKEALISKSREKHIKKHKEIILEIEKSILEKLNLNWYDKEFFSDYARSEILNALIDSMEKDNPNKRKEWIEYSIVLIGRYSVTGNARSVFERLSFLCPSFKYNMSEIQDSKTKKRLFNISKSGRILQHF